MRQARPFTGYITKLFPPPFHKNAISTNDTIKNELFASIEMYSDVKAYGRSILKAHGHATLSTSLAAFRGYVRQARVFYDAADTLHHRASPLLYYYSFCNFAKAYVLLKDPQFVDNKLHHGLTYDFKKMPLRQQRIIVKQNGVFPLFYSRLTGANIPNNAKLNVGQLLGYSTDVAFEYENLKFGFSRSCPCKLAFVTNAATQQSHAVVAINTWSNQEQFRQFQPKYLKAFDEVQLDAARMKMLFDFSVEDAPVWQFLETKAEFPSPAKNSIPTGAIANHLTSAFGSSLSFDPFDDPTVFRIDLPIATPKKRPMQELLAVYCIMFYLGTLVRYRPQFLESLLETKDAWIIERFVKQAPITFLRHVRNLIDGNYLALASR